MVRVEVDDPFAAGVTELVLRVQLGARDGDGETEQLRLTALANPFTDETVIVEVADCPGDTDVALKFPALKLKSGAP
jgi:hypothetical protein